MNDIDKMPTKCRDCPYWERAAEPYVCSDCTTPVKKCGGDYILRSDALKALSRGSGCDNICSRAINRIPAADVVSVVRCKDCKHRDPENLRCDSGGLERAGCIFTVSDNYFCAHGKRKEADDAE